jgi:hypothetical protein
MFPEWTGQFICLQATVIHGRTAVVHIINEAYFIFSFFNNINRTFKRIIGYVQSGPTLIIGSIFGSWNNGAVLKMFGTITLVVVF